MLYQGCDWLSKTEVLKSLCQRQDGPTESKKFIFANLAPPGFNHYHESVFLFFKKLRTKKKEEIGETRKNHSAVIYMQ